MKKITNFLFSTRLMSVVIIIYAVAMAVATFVENDYSTQTAKALVYNTWWFELLMFLLMINFVGNIVKYKLHKRKKWPVLLFHIAFIVALLGAFVTRYYGFEGMMLIREGKVSNTILTEKTFVEVHVDGEKGPLSYNPKNVLFGALSSNYFDIKGDYYGEKFNVSYVDYIPNVKSVFEADETGVKHLHLVVSTQQGRKDLYIKDQNIESFNQQLYSLNKPISGAMNFIEKNGTIYFQPMTDGTYMHMQTQEKTPVFKDSITPLQFKKLYSFPTMGFVITDPAVKGEFKQIPAPKAEQNKYPYDAIVLNITSGDESKQVMVFGAQNQILAPVKTSLNNMDFTIRYGSLERVIPFSIKLRDFELDRYPGSNSPSSYASEITVMDKDSTFDYRIFMNHVLDYKGYRFFQSNYDPDEMGTHLSVNHDYWGTLLTYIAYFLMAFGMFFSVFKKGSRFRALSDKLNKVSKNKSLLLFVLFSLAGSVVAQEQDSIAKYTVNKEHADKFGKLLIQDYQGRIKPINTYALDVLHKVYKSDTYHDLTAEQIVLSTQVFPKFWNTQKLLKVSKTVIGSTIAKDLQAEDGYTSMNDLLKGGNYYLSNKINEVYRKKDPARTATDKEIIKLDEKANIWWNLVKGSLLNIYPKYEDENNKWFTGTDTKAFVKNDTMILKMHQMYLSSLREAVSTNDYTVPDEYLEHISNYQKKIGASIIPSDKRIDFEILYNRSRVFFFLLIYLFMIGALLFVLAFVDVLQVFQSDNAKRWLKHALSFATILAFIGMLVHGTALGFRWYISGHAPWSNSYETILFIAFATLLAGLTFTIKTNEKQQKSKFIIAVAVLFAALLLGIAHGNSMNPEMTNLVPVLKSYWLMIHVAVIAGSYGFLGLGSLLGFIVLLLYIIRTEENKKRINDTIKELTIANELTLIVGLYTLTIGTFLGGVWANESWGRYWGWDPKEVWSLISMMVYIFVLHMRIVPGLKSKFTFNLWSMFSIGTLIMTYFGVNYYLSGMHSYATGDPVPVQPWMFYTLGLFILFAGVSYWRYSRFSKKK